MNIPRQEDVHHSSVCELTVEFFLQFVFYASTEQQGPQPQPEVPQGHIRLIYLQHMFGHLLNTLRDVPAMLCLIRKRSKNKQVKRALNEIGSAA
jgi:hypothetical protein